MTRSTQAACVHPFIHIPTLLCRATIALVLIVVAGGGCSHDMSRMHPDGAGVLILDHNTPDQQSISEYIEVFEDSTNALTIGDILSNAVDAPFGENRIPRDLLDSQRGTVWGRFRARNVTDETLRFYLTMYTRDTTMLYYTDGSVVSHTEISGAEVPLADRSLPYVPFTLGGTFTLELRAGQDVTVYIRSVNGRYGRMRDRIEATLRITDYYQKERRETLALQGVYGGIVLAVLVYFIAIFFSTRDKSYLWAIAMALFSLCFFLAQKGVGSEYLWGHRSLFFFEKFGLLIFTHGFALSGFFLVAKLLNLGGSRPRLFFGLLGSLLAIQIGEFPFRFTSLSLLALTMSNYLLLAWMLTVTGVIVFFMIRGSRPAWLLFVSIVAMVAGGVVLILKNNQVLPQNVFTENVYQIGSALQLLLFALALADTLVAMRKDTIASQAAMIRALSEKEQLVAMQNVMLEQKVEERTRQLQDTQQQLIMQEKLASLGQLTAGIAHEIKNPLNFVNNFSRLSVSQLSELEIVLEEHREGRIADAEEDLAPILDNLKLNVAKIGEHGKRADDIVRNMMEHAQGGSGERMRTDVNTLVSETANLALHSAAPAEADSGLTIRRELDSATGSIDLIPQDIGKALFNIMLNACYAVKERASTATDGYVPEVTTATKRVESGIEIRVRDNGNGIPAEFRERIFEPFFTTKPTGVGTGLGLSITFDIITAHKGSITCESEEGAFTEFTVILPG